MITKGKEEFEFKAGDIVEWCGKEWVLRENNDPFTKKQYRLLIRHDGHETDFTVLGYRYSADPGPSLKLIRRPKKMVRKTEERWLNLYTNGTVVSYRDKENADGCANLVGGRLACQKVTFEYEAEEE